MTTGPIELTELAPAPAAVVRGHVGAAQITEFLSAAYSDVLRLLQDQHRAPAGPPFARYTPVGDGFDVEAGFPSGASIDPSDRVVGTVLPGGRVVTAVHHGSYDSVGATYDALTAWMTAHGCRPSGVAWESYLDEPDVAVPRTRVSAPCVPR